MASAIQENWINNAWVTSLKQEYTWTGDRPTQVIESSNVNGVWVITGKSIYDWTANDSFTMTSYTYENLTWTESFRLVNNYDSHGNTTLVEGDFYYGNTWTIVSGSKFDLTYNGNNLTQRITQQYTIAMWQNYKKEVFSNFASLGTGVTVMPDKGLSIYPNPAGKQATVRMTNVEPGSVTFSLLSMTGQKVLEEIVNGNGNDIHFELNLERVPRGTYLLMALDRNGAEIGKTRLIKE
jgi:hypothetical protein